MANYLAELASKKKLPVRFLESIGIRGGRDVITIPYFDLDGEQATERYRNAKQFWWKKGSKAMPYGLNRIDKARQQKRLFVVEGESDCWALWHCGLPALGIPGASNCGCLPREALEWIAKLYIHREPGQSGDTFLDGMTKRLADLDYGGEVYEMRSGDGCKDPSDWFVKMKADGTAFALHWNAAAKKAVKLHIGTPLKAQQEEAKRRTIEVTTHEVAVNDQAIDALAKDSTIFHRGGQLVQVMRETGPTIRTIPAALLREKLTASVSFVNVSHDKDGHEKKRLIHPPDWCIRAVEARGDWPGIRRLAGVTEFPVLLPNGHILHRAGYDPESCILLDGDIEVNVPRRPTKKEVFAAIDLIGEVVADFPFVDQSGRCAYLAALLTPVARFAFDGPTPLFLVDANTRGTGKSLLVQTLFNILTGRTAGPISYPDTNEDRRKIITSIAGSGLQLVFLDNLSGAFGDKVLDQVLTSDVWTDRVFHSQRMVTTPMTAVWYATGNNLSVVADTGRRVLPIRLETSYENPEERGGFKHPDLLAYCRGRRADFLSALLTLLRAWVVAGKPVPELKPWGSYEAWTAVVRACIVWCGLTDPREACGTITSQVDSEAQQMAALLELWERIDPDGKGISVSEVFDWFDRGYTRDEAQEEIHGLLTEMLRKPEPRAFSYLLRKYKRRNLAGRYIDIKSTVAGNRRWAVFPAEEFACVS